MYENSHLFRPFWKSWAHYISVILWVPIDQVISASQRTQGNKGRKGISLVSTHKSIMLSKFNFSQCTNKRQEKKPCRVVGIRAHLLRSYSLLPNTSKQLIRKNNFSYQNITCLQHIMNKIYLKNSLSGSCGFPLSPHPRLEDKTQNRECGKLCEGEVAVLAASAGISG